jgi:type IV pilus assembly protein PilW
MYFSSSPVVSAPAEIHPAAVAENLDSRVRGKGRAVMETAKMKRANRGFSLVEIMVALVIGMIGVLVIMQVARTSEAQKRMTTGSGDSQNNGALAIYAVQRDVKQGGYGFNALNILGCPLTFNATPGVNLPVLAPVTINSSLIPAADANTDTLLVVYGSGAGAPEGETIVDTSASNIDLFGISSVSHFKINDWVVAAPLTPDPDCALVMSKVVWVGASPQEPEGGSGSGGDGSGEGGEGSGSGEGGGGESGEGESGGDGDGETTSEKGGDSDVSQWVKVSGIGKVSSGSLFNFGHEPKIIGYAVRGGNLTTCDYAITICSDVGNWIVVANGIVSLKAQYGRDTHSPRSGVNVWDRATPKKEDLSDARDQSEFACRWARVSAIRLALAARNGEWDRSETTTTVAPTWTGSVDIDPATGHAATVGNPIDLSNPDAPDDWRHYRYQVYETVIPLRNIPWMETCS